MIRRVNELTIDRFARPKNNSFQNRRLMQRRVFFFLSEGVEVISPEAPLGKVSVGGGVGDKRAY